MYTQAKCKKCRKIIVEKNQSSKVFLNAHSEPLNDSETDCPTIADQKVVFLAEEALPEWIMLKIQEAEWCKGRLNCEKCDFRVGGFDFISGSKCGCTKSVLPAVHLIKSKVDLTRN